MKNAAASTTASGDAADDSDDDEPVCHDAEITRRTATSLSSNEGARELGEVVSGPKSQFNVPRFPQSTSASDRPIFGLLTARFGLNHISKSPFPSTQRQNFLDVITALSSATL